MALVAQGGREADASLPCQVIFITEYVSSGSLKQFLKKTKKNHKAMNARVGSLGAAQGVPGEAGGTERVSGLLQGRRSVCGCSLNYTGTPTVGRWPLGEGWSESRTSPGQPQARVLLSGSDPELGNLPEAAAGMFSCMVLAAPGASGGRRLHHPH